MQPTTAKPKDCTMAQDIEMKVVAKTESPNIPYASQGLQTNRTFVYKQPSHLSQSFDNTLNKRVRLNPFLVSLDTLEAVDDDPDMHHVAVEIDEDRYQSRTVVFEPPINEKSSKLKHIHVVPAVSTPTFVPSITAHLVQPSDVVEDKKVRKSCIRYTENYAMSCFFVYTIFVHMRVHMYSVYMIVMPKHVLLHVHIDVHVSLNL